MTKVTMVFSTLCVLLLATTATFADDDHGHEGDIIVGRTAGGQLSFEGEFDVNNIFEDLIGLSPTLGGWSGDEPGFTNLDADEPDEGFFTLASGVDLKLELVSLTNGLQFFDFFDFGLVDTPGQTLQLNQGGATEFDSHPLFFISNTILPNYDGEVLSAEFKFVDMGSTNYGDSEVFQLNFVPEPMSLTLLGLGGLALIRRRG